MIVNPPFTEFYTRSAYPHFYGVVHLEPTYAVQIFYLCQKKIPGLIPSVEMLVLRVGVFPLKGFILASKLGEVKFCKRVNLAVCCSIYCTVSSACAAMSGMHL